MKKLLNSVAAAAITLLAGACAQAPTVWDKPGATPGEFNKTKYQCLKENQVPYSTSSLYGTGGRYAYVSGGSSSGVTTDISMARACMESQGWYRVKPKANGEAK